jgi:DNA (cytosine-5)-methyltransferase 1
MPRYAGDTFVQADALEYLAAHGNEYAAIHASPPCQRYSVSTAAFRAAGKDYPDLLGETRQALSRTGRPWVIENVPSAPMRRDIVLCGCMFPGELPGLKRERWFEVSWGPVAQLRPPCHHPEPIVTVVGHGPNHHSHYRRVHGAVWTQLKHRAMGIDWMRREELSEAIPPAYTRWLGEQLMHHLYPPGAAVLPTKTAAAPGHHHSQGARFGTLRAPWGSVPNVP